MLNILLIGLLFIPQFFSSQSLTNKETIKDGDHDLHLFNHAGACDTQLGRSKDDPLYFATNSNYPLDPATSGFMGTHGTYRFLSMHQKTALLIGETKHGFWRYQENGFIRVYRVDGKAGIPLDNKTSNFTDISNRSSNEDEQTKRFLDILEGNYNSIDPTKKFNYHFGNESESDGEHWLNWIDLPIYHAKFDKKYKDHDPIDLSVYYCQMSSANFPHLGDTWDLIKAQHVVKKVGPLGKRAGLDIKENFNNVVRLHQLPGAGVWANIGQGKRDQDFMPKTLDELKTRAQTVNYKRIDKDKMEIETYLIERAYHNFSDTFITVLLTMDDKADRTKHSYIRPHGKYYDYLRKKGHPILNTEPNHNPTVPIINESESKQIYGLATFGHHHMARVKRGLGGGGCPTKGGDIGTYPFGNIGAGYPTNYEEITPICDAILIDLKMFANLNTDSDSWEKDDWDLGNSAFSGKTIVTFQAQANLYGRFSDPYNIKLNKKNPYELDFTVDHKIQEYVEDDSNVPVVNFTIDFGILGKFNQSILPTLDRTPRGCLASEKRIWIILVCFGILALLLLPLGAWLIIYIVKIKSNRKTPALPQPDENVEFPVKLVMQDVETPT